MSDGLCSWPPEGLRAPSDVGWTLQLASGGSSGALVHFSAVPVIAIAFVSSRCTGWTNSRPRTSILRPQTQRFHMLSTCNRLYMWDGDGGMGLIEPHLTQLSLMLLT